MAQMTVRIDDNLKVQAEMLFAEIGMPLSTAVTIFLNRPSALTVCRFRSKPILSFPLKTRPVF